MTSLPQPSSLVPAGLTDLPKLEGAPKTGTEETGAGELLIVVIENRTFLRDCIARCLKAGTGVTVKTVSSVEEWLALSETLNAALIVLSRSGRPKEEEETARELRELLTLSQGETRIPVIVLSDCEDNTKIVNALENGARGYIPTSLPLEVALGAIGLVRAGGIFVPATSLITAHRMTETAKCNRRPSFSMFTSRQMAVVEALRKGKANKLIAFELNMRESTVKVHVRNIMKKLKAKNRTQVAYMASELLRRDQA